MNMLENIPYNKSFLIDNDYHFGGIRERLYLEKTYHKGNASNHYFLKLFVLTESGRWDCQGYIYFYLDFKELESRFIGIYVKPEYRSKGLASLLVSNWIKLCLDNGINNLQTNKKQRKPALLYLLKNYTFELENPELYDISKYTINICEGTYDHLKYLYFKNENQKEHFLHSTIMREGNYCVLDQIDKNVIVLDSILLSTPYYIQNENEAYTRSLKCIEGKKLVLTE